MRNFKFNPEGSNLFDDTQGDITHLGHLWCLDEVVQFSFTEIIHRKL